MSTYMGMHLKYTLPVIGVLALITRPFLCRMETTKIAFISTVALLYSTLCYNYSILNGARTYSPEKVSGFIGNVPVEEYMSVVLHTVLVSLWAYICLRWKPPFLNFNHDQQSYQTIRWIPILLLGVVTAVGYGMAVPGRETFYLGSIMCWASPIIMLMWYGAGNYFVKHFIPSSIAIAMPTLYLWWINRMALEEDIWHVNKTTSLNVSVAQGLPLEEALFTFITTGMVVLAGSCYDKAYGMIITFSLIFPHQFSISWKFISQMFKAFVTSEYSMPSIVTEDLKYCMQLANSANIFGTTNHIFDSALRLDFIIIYVFTRVTDNVIDDESDFELKKEKLKLFIKFLDEIFADRKSDYEVKSKPQEIKIDWEKYESQLTREELGIFRAFSRIAFLLPRKPFEELFAGYELDMSDTLYKDEKDLLVYFTLVAGSFGAMCIYIIMYRYNIDKDFVEKDDSIIKKSYQIGNAMQFVNIARDLICDSESWGRCYFPLECMDDEKEDVKIFCQEKNPRSLGEQKLRRYSKMMMKLADKHHYEALDVINRLPREIRGAIRSSIEVYRDGILGAIQSSSKFPYKAKLSTFNKLTILFKFLYIKSMQYVI